MITRLLGRTLSGSVTGGIMLMPINSDHTLATSQMFASGGDYDPIAVTPGSGNFLYAIDLTTNHLAAFSIDSSKGALTAIGPQGPPLGVAVGPDPFNVVVDPQGKFVFVANCDCVTNPQNQGSVSVFSINSDGTLTAVPGRLFPRRRRHRPSRRPGGFAGQPVSLCRQPGGNPWHSRRSVRRKHRGQRRALRRGACSAGRGFANRQYAPVSIAVST